jgi:hypothetical protein
MKGLLSLFIGLTIFASPVVAQGHGKGKAELKKPHAAKEAKTDQLKGAHFELNLTTGTADTAEVDPFAIYVAKSGVTVIHISPSADTSLAVTDADGTDGEAAFSLPAGDYNVYARPAGKPGGSAQLQDLTFTRAKKGKTGFAEAAGVLPAEQWTYANSGLSALQLRLYSKGKTSGGGDSVSVDTTGQ